MSAFIFSRLLLWSPNKFSFHYKLVPALVSKLFLLSFQVISVILPKWFCFLFRLISKQLLSNFSYTLVFSAVISNCFCFHLQWILLSCPTEYSFYIFMNFTFIFKCILLLCPYDFCCHLVISEFFSKCFLISPINVYFISHLFLFPGRDCNPSDFCFRLQIYIYF